VVDDAPTQKRFMII